MTSAAGPLLPRGFFHRPALTVARDLLGVVIEHAGVAVRLTEVEAYDGANDPASHAYRGETARNAVMFGPPGHLYVYFTYGMHFCMNLVCQPEGTASAVLLRAGEVISGRDAAAKRRPGSTVRDLARGPARMCRALDIDRALNGVDVTRRTSVVTVRRGIPIGEDLVTTGPRVGIAEAADRPWRLWIAGEPTVSVYRPHVRRARRR